MTSPDAPKLDDPGRDPSRLEVPADVRLAVLVVYHFDDALQGLIEVHVDHLRRHAPAGSAILGAAIRLKPEHYSWLAAQPDLRLPKIGPLPEAFRLEHNGALDRLAEVAFDEGATHVATFHQDSFPVRSDWLARLLVDLDDETPFAVAERRAYNSCMLWGRNWQARNPTMLASDALRDRAADQLAAERPDLDPVDGGIGHLLLARSLGMQWRALRHTAPDILDGMILHLTGSTRIAHEGRIQHRDSALATSLRSIARPVFPHLPKRFRKTVGRLVGVQAIQDRKVPIGGDGSAEEKRAQIGRLVADPEAYIAAALQEAPSSGVQWANQRRPGPSYPS